MFSQILNDATRMDLGVLIVSLLFLIVGSFSFISALIIVKNPEYYGENEANAPLLIMAFAALGFIGSIIYALLRFIY